MIKQRLEIEQIERYCDKIIDSLKNNPGSCDEVWVFLDRHNNLEILKKNIPIAKDFKEKLAPLGIKFSVEFCPFGHGHPKSDLYRHECEDFTVDSNGTTTYGQYCWRSKKVVEQKVKTLLLIAELEPYNIYFDDDLRVKNWGGGLRCFCPNCIKEFNAKHGTDYTREEIADLIETDVAFRKKCLEFSYDGLEKFAYECAKTIAKFSPNTNIGVEHGDYAGEGYLRCINAIFRATNKTVRSRSGAGSYNDDNPHALSNKTFETQHQLSLLPNFVDDYCNEIENYPSTYYSKTAYGTCLEASLHLASGFNTTSIKCWKMEDYELFDDVLRESAKRRRYWEELSACSTNGVKSGLQIFVPENYLDEKGENWAVTPGVHGWPYNVCGIAMTYAKTEKRAYFLDENFVSTVTEEELKTLLALPVVTTGVAVCKLCERGFSNLLGIKAEYVTDPCYLEEFIDHPVNYGFVGDCWGNTLFYNGNACRIIDDGNHVEILGVYKLDFFAKEVLGDSVVGAISSAIVTTALGGKWFVQGYNSSDNTISWNKRQQINNAIRYITGGLLAEHISRNRLMLCPIENKDGKLINVSVINNTIALQENIKLVVRNTLTTNAILMDEFGSETPLGMTPIKNGYEIEVSSLPGWTMKTIFFK